jgi:hypothetical protein
MSDKEYILTIIKRNLRQQNDDSVTIEEIYKYITGMTFSEAWLKRMERKKHEQHKNTE